jgi:spermidine/putrescine transport system substrate-binding protein
MSDTLKFLGWRGLNKPDVGQIHLAPRGLRMEFEYVRNGSNMVRLLQGRRAGDVDLVTPSTDFGPRTKWELEPLLEPLDMEKIPNARGIFEGFQTYPWDMTGKPLTLPLLWGDSPMVYNPQTVRELPTRYADLADASWKGKVVIRNEMYCVLWMFSASLGHEDPGRITLRQLGEVRRLARAIKENAYVAANYREMKDLLVRGQAQIAVSGWQLMCHWAEVESGVGLDFATPKHDPKYWWADGYAIMRNAPNKDEAYAFLNHMLAPESNAALAWEMQSCSVTHAGFDLMHPKLQNFYDTDLVSEPSPREGPLTRRVSYLPPLERNGDIAGDADWQAVWLDFLIS